MIFQTYHWKYGAENRYDIVHFPNSIWQTLMDSEVGCVLDLNMDAILAFYWIIVFVSHFQINFVLHIGEESCVKIQDLVIDFEFDIHIHRIDGC